MPDGKPAGVPCIQLDENLACKIFGQAGRPAVCAGLQASAEMCKNQRDEALLWLTCLEEETRPS